MPCTSQQETADPTDILLLLALLCPADLIWEVRGHSDPDDLSHPVDDGITEEAQSRGGGVVQWWGGGGVHGASS